MEGKDIMKAKKERHIEESGVIARSDVMCRFFLKCAFII
jgi:hypothetical protein